MLCSADDERDLSGGGVGNGEKGFPVCADDVIDGRGLKLVGPRAVSVSEPETRASGVLMPATTFLPTPRADAQDIHEYTPVISR